MPIEIDALGTARFGVTLARTIDTNANVADLNIAAADLGIDMLTTRLDCGAHARVHALEADGHRLMDSLVYYTRCLTTGATVDTDLTVRLATPADATAVADVARLAFRKYLGHFHSDPKLDSTSADAAYIEWAETSIRNIAATKPALVVQTNNEIAGFLTLRQNTLDEWEIVLNAVDPRAQGKGLYGHLLSAAIRHAYTNVDDPKKARIITSTQLNNYPVQRAWSRRGFYIDHALHTFHKWY